MHRSSYRAWRDRPKTLAPDEQRLRERVKATHMLSNGSAGQNHCEEGDGRRASVKPLSRAGACRRWAYLAMVLDLFARRPVGVGVIVDTRQRADEKGTYYGL